MFERRLKIILSLLAVVVIVILSRAAEVQIVRHDYWKGQAADVMTLTHFVPAMRGKIYDRNGKLLAFDTPCIDACIEYRALTSPPDPDWVKQKAASRLTIRLGDNWNKPMTSAQVKTLREQEVEAVRDDIKSMWDRLADVSGRPIEDIETTREAIIRKVETRQRYVWFQHYKKALNKEGEKVETSSWKTWIADGGESDANDSLHSIVVAEQLEPHVVLAAVSSDVQNELGRHIDRYPGLVLRPGTHRSYPYNDVACHVLGHLAHVDNQDLTVNKGLDDVHMYQRDDLIGKSGIEAMCEPALRGIRGKVERVQGEDKIVAGKEPVAGKDVRLSIDIELQQMIQSAFANAEVHYPDPDHTVQKNTVLHGAAIVLDISTNQVLAMVSYPTYDENRFDEIYAAIHNDDVNDPLTNRATMAELEPGSTMKPFTGLAGISNGVVGVNEGIECTGFLVLDGRKYPYGRCWVDSKFHDILGGATAHHPVPYLHAHVGHDGNPDGWLTYSDALERSCNVYFETVADRLGIDRFSKSLREFGFGRPTGIDLGEHSGRLPDGFPANMQALRRSTGFFAGIGQGYIGATPIQMANGAAMIARNGIWMRPQLLIPDGDGKIPVERSAASSRIPDRVDLNLSPEAMVAARRGMFDVVNSPAGTGEGLVAGNQLLEAMGICGKTGTAQVGLFTVPIRDEAGKLVRDKAGRVLRRKIEASTFDHSSVEAPWYRGVVGVDGKMQLNHAWYIGFAPAIHPKIAFAVMVEYGISGGNTAAGVAREAIVGCMSQGYLPVPAEDSKRATPEMLKE